jgi:hypothetical protein
MSSTVIVAFPSGFRVPAVLELSGPFPLTVEGPSEFSVDWVDASGDVLFHFNPRPESAEIVLNSLLDGAWGEEIALRAFPFAVEPQAPFLLRFEVRADRFRVTLDGVHLCDFPHRRSPEALAAVRSTAFFWRLDGGKAHPPEGRPPWLPSSPSGWVIDAEQPARPEPLEAFRLFAVLGTWMEEDVVAATVGNAFAQGCERVYLIDNASSDATVERAVAAGAILARSFREEHYEELERLAQMQEVVDEVSAAAGDQHIWWLWLDADEFYRGPDGLTVHEYLATLDRSFRVVGARFLNHLPSHEPAYVDGRDPLEFQSLYYEMPTPNCELAHYKHPLLRLDRDGTPIRAGGGFHVADSDELLVEPRRPLTCHHFSFRAEESTRRRLARLVGEATETEARTRGDEKCFSAHLRVRLRALDAVYGQDWEHMPIFPPCVPGYPLELRDWGEESEDVEPAASRRVLG